MKGIITNKERDYEKPASSSEENDAQGKTRKFTIFWTRSKTKPLNHHSERI